MLLSQAEGRLHTSYINPFLFLPLLEFRLKSEWLRPSQIEAGAKQNTNRSFFKAQMVMTLSVFSHMNQLPIGHTVVHCMVLVSSNYEDVNTFISSEMEQPNALNNRLFLLERTKKSQAKIPKQRPHTMDQTSLFTFNDFTKVIREIHKSPIWRVHSYSLKLTL